MAHPLSIWDSIYKNLIAGGAWQTILKGLLTTVRISVFGLLCGLVVGALLCAMSRARFKPLSWLSTAYIVLVRGTPVVMLLMLLFYVVFARTRVSAELIAIIGFSLNSGAHIAEIMKTSLDSVSEGQIKAARTLGFTGLQAFRYVTLPQAWRYARPVLQNTVVSTIQWTSVVGTITIADLTRVVNNMGSRTAQPFFAMVVGILLYLLLAGLTTLLFSIGKPKGRSNT